MPQLLKLAGLVPSTSDAIRQIAGGGVRLDGERVADKGLSVPVGFTAAGLPVGLQILGDVFSEDRLLAEARAGESEAGAKKPPLLA